MQESKMATLVNNKLLLQKPPLPLNFREISFHTPPTDISQKNFRKSRLRLPSGDLGRSGHGRSSHLGPHAPGGRASLPRGWGAHAAKAHDNGND